MPLRRSGRTTAALEEAIILAEQGHRVHFVVWEHAEIRMTMDMLFREPKYQGVPLKNFSVVTYEHLRKFNPCGKAVFDHRVIEELHYRRTGQREPDMIKVVLECNGWHREQIIPIDTFNCGYYRFAMAEPLSTMCWSEDEYACDATATMKVVEFERTSYTKNGLIVFKHEG